MHSRHLKRCRIESFQEDQAFLSIDKSGKHPSGAIIITVLLVRSDWWQIELVADCRFSSFISIHYLIVWTKKSPKTVKGFGRLVVKSIVWVQGSPSFRADVKDATDDPPSEPVDVAPTSYFAILYL